MGLLVVEPELATWVEEEAWGVLPGPPPSASPVPRGIVRSSLSPPALIIAFSRIVHFRPILKFTSESHYAPV
jgi:hypothetical protein